MCCTFVYREAGIFATGGPLKRPDDRVGDGEEVNIFMPIGGR
jgi:hypothetical protein